MIESVDFYRPDVQVLNEELCRDLVASHFRTFLFFSDAVC